MIWWESHHSDDAQPSPLLDVVLPRFFDRLKSAMMARAWELFPTPVINPNRARLPWIMKRNHGTNWLSIKRLLYGTPLEGTIGGVRTLEINPQMSDDHSRPYGTRSDSGHAPTVREAHAAATTWLPWSEHLVTFDESDQPKHSVDIGRFPLVISAVLKTIRATKIFMDKGSDSNLIYWDTFERLKISTDKLRPPRGPITRIGPGRQVMPLGIIDLRVTFGEAVNFR
jgi:hypothetical protein